MAIGRRSFLAVSALLAASRRAWAQPAPRLKIGVLTDLSGPYANDAGLGSIACTRLAARDFASPDFDIDVISADHHNDVAIGSAIARDWFAHQGVDMIVDVPNSEVALAVADIARHFNKVYINCGAGTGALTGADCSPTTVQWSYDTNMLARSTGGALVASGGATWYFVSADYSFGRQIEADASHFIMQAGGRIEGTSRYKFPGTHDFSPMLSEAQASGAQVLGLANAGDDLVNCVRQARQAGVADQMRIACLLMLLPDVHNLGLEAAQGLVLTESFYWDMNARTRAFTQRLMATKPPPNYPNMIHAGCYAGTLHYLKTVAALGLPAARQDGAACVAHMKSMPTDDDAFGTGSIRSDGRAMFPAYLFQVKSPAESAGPWDFYRALSTTDADEAYLPLSVGGCAMARS